MDFIAFQDNLFNFYVAFARIPLIFTFIFALLRSAPFSRVIFAFLANFWLFLGFRLLKV